jgi:5'-nucleotidase
MTDPAPTADELVIFGKDQQRNPDLRLLHYNDVYHVDPSSAEPAGGVARFITVSKHYTEDAKFKRQPELVTFFSGDAFNPSLESSVTKGALTSTVAGLVKTGKNKVLTFMEVVIWSLF